ncbi:hypothetical protein IFM89_035252 [Coptis chinensis]|uniref:Uncharacterized protein n=1 Tax=Coptis chinensis TaxID=261450 RepID=A0A835H269_9MAGN|nr:hypothetical protein IFM89_035252 [Coptis chinensis]
MLLLDYTASSSSVDEEEDTKELQNKEEEKERELKEEHVINRRRNDVIPPPPQTHNIPQRSTSVGRLPDASLLLNAPDFSSHEMSQSDYHSRVAATIESWKRESNGSATSSYPCSKFPRSNLPHSRNVPDTVGGLLVPPQLSGRSNVVTEDLSKLFVRRTT